MGRHHRPIHGTMLRRAPKRVALRTVTIAVSQPWTPETMTQDIDIARIAALVGEPARAAMLLALGDGRALSAGELAACAAVSASTASGHLAAMRAAGLLDSVQQGRHRYYRLASAQVAAMLESLMLVAAQNPARLVSSRVDPLLQAGRTCYGHLAGRLGVALSDALQRRQCIQIEDDIAHLTPAGIDFLGDFGLDATRLHRHPFAKTCIDWSERRHHLGGPVGVGLYRCCLERGWVRHQLDSRAVAVTSAGARGFETVFGVVMEA